jgi:drug/metabolite transporter (DMT)-like permease
MPTAVRRPDLHSTLLTSAGLLITLMQFILVAIFVYPSQSSPRPPFFLKKTKIPLRVLLGSASMFFAVNMLNNWAFAFDISVPVHIILRSFGSVTTMGAGWLNGKRYSRVQVASVCALTLGVMVSAWADAVSKAGLFLALRRCADSGRANRWTRTWT